MILSLINNTLGARGFFFLLFAASGKKTRSSRSRSRLSLFFFPLVTIAAWPLNFHRKQQEKKPLAPRVDK